jgi:glycosyltransferase involved in cell wall biosynthesis
MNNNKTICLNMIVKDESAVIERGLQKIKGWIDHWVIVDTGSTDGTQKIIQECLKGIPGELYERPWVDFAHNRNEALSLARNKADYLFFADADEEVIVTSPIDKSGLDKDFYCILLADADINYHRILMINNDPGWVWKGVLHEYITNDNPVTGEILSGIVINVAKKGGNRSFDPQRQKKDAEILEKALADDPENSRTVFYLGQIYLGARELLLALKYFEKRASMPEALEEVYWSHYYSGCIQMELKMDPEGFIDRFYKAYQSNPNRAEPLYRLSFYFNQSGNHILAYILAKHASTLSIPPFYAAIEKSVYDYGVLFELAHSAYSLEKVEEACSIYEKLLANENIPASYRELMAKNLKLAQKAAMK